MPKFFIDNENIEQEKVIILGEDVNHIKNVLRKNIKDTLEICDAQNGKNFFPFAFLHPWFFNYVI